jgi:hypothetical protein
MKLDRNRNADGAGKYAVVRLRRMDGASPEQRHALDLLITGGFVTMDRPGGDEEFFVVMLQDKYAPATLRKYAEEAEADDPEYAAEVRELAARAAAHPRRKKPD